jgi:hypothetical protein
MLSQTHNFLQLFFSNSNHSLQYGFSDVNWAADNDDRKSIGVHCSFHGRNHISWSCKKQKKIACSSMESEYKSLSNSAAEIQWLHSILQYDLLTVPSYGVIILEKHICLRIDPMFHAKAKHIEIDSILFQIRFYRRNFMSFFVSTKDQFVDLLTRRLSIAHKFILLQTNRHVQELPIWLRKRNLKTYDI